jgi:hypothetical protein
MCWEKYERLTEQQEQRETKLQWLEHDEKEDVEQEPAEQREDELVRA